MVKAYKEPSLNDSTISSELAQERERFNSLTTKWAEISKELLFDLEQKKKYLTEGKNPNSLMALGALEVHLNMAIHALKASEKEE